MRTGLPFRETHSISGRVVALAENEGLAMDQLTLEQFKSVDERFGDDVLEVFNYERAVELKMAPGGTSRTAVAAQISNLRGKISH